jgi:cell division protein FtsB
MAVRSRARAILFPIVFYVVLGVASGYLVRGAWNGDRGLKAKAEYTAEMQTLAGQLTQLKAERASWERRVALMRPEAVDRDLLDEEARAQLDRVGKNDLVVFLDQGQGGRGAAPGSAPAGGTSPRP